MNLPALRLLLLALPLAACSQAEQTIPEFETVTIDLRETGVAFAGRLVPLPTHKPGYAIASPAYTAPAAVASAPEPVVETYGDSTVASSRASRWIPDFGGLTDCPNGVLCNAFTN
jgi:hypothetical protein